MISCQMAARVQGLDALFDEGVFTSFPMEVSSTDRKWGQFHLQQDQVPDEPVEFEDERAYALPSLSARGTALSRTSF
jgi:hypothetical protein